MGNAYENYGPVVRAWISFMPVFFILDPKDVELILSNRVHNWKPSIYEFSKNFIGTGITLSNGIKWAKNRRLLQPSFRSTALDEYIEPYRRAAKLVLGKFDTRLGVPTNIVTPIIQALDLIVCGE